MSTILFDQQTETAGLPKVLNRRKIVWWVGGLLLAAVLALIAWRVTQALTAKPEAVVVGHSNGIGNRSWNKRGALDRQHHRHHCRAL